MTDESESDLLAPHRLDLRSADVVEPRIEALAELLPEVVRDGKVDVDALRAALGDLADEGPERFGLTWPGKADAIRMAQRRAEGTLVPMKDESVEWDTTKNVIIEGENLEVLKLLQRSYHGKVKLIYIDPPYNTGKDFVYPDDFRDPLNEYLRYSGQLGENGGRLRANAETGGRYHSAWLSICGRGCIWLGPCFATTESSSFLSTMSKRPASGFSWTKSLVRITSYASSSGTPRATSIIRAPSKAYTNIWCATRGTRMGSLGRR